MLLEHERKYGLGLDALVTAGAWNTNGIMVWAWMLWSPYALGTRTELWFGHGCSGHRRLMEHERNYRLGMGALVTELLAVVVFREGRKLQPCSKHCEGQQK